MINRFSITATIVIVLIAVVTTMILRNQSPLINPSYDRLTRSAQKEVQCLAKNIYFEARKEPIEGQKAVAFVTLNRVASGHFPDNICEVVEQKIRNTCQFSWYCEKVPKYLYENELLTKRNDPLYNEIRDLATYVYANYEKLPDPTRGALFFHATHVSPGWNNVIKVTKIGNHIFYTKRNNT
jgi:spore germination cell wall hydrolase CwlJ-like protein